MDMAENDEHRALHYAVLGRDAAMVKLLMEAGADAHKGIFPHRDATSALAIARDRGYEDIVAVIEDEERLRRAEMSCPNATISPVQDEINHAIRERRQRYRHPLAADRRLVDPGLRSRGRDAAAHRRARNERGDGGVAAEAERAKTRARRIFRA